MEKLIERVKNDPDNVISKLDPRKLTELINYLSDNYYNKGRSLISDELFDYLQSFKKTVSIGHPVDKKKAKLPFFMASLDKIKPSSNQFDKWLDHFYGPFVFSHKLDGVSGLLYKHDERLYLYTRGDGVYGQDISHLIPYLRFNGSLSEGECVRGEFIISKDNFKKISGRMSNARNAVTGIINSKIPNKELLSFIDFLCYSVLSPNLKIHDQFIWLQQRSFTTPFYCLEKLMTIDKLSQELLRAREQCPYEIDGIVVCDNSKVYDCDLSSNPKYAFAFKQVLMDQVAETTVIDVLWDVSKDKYLKPRVKIETVELLGSEISYATAHNAKYIFENRIGPGSRIVIIKSGDVIPYIQKILKPSDSGFPKMPDCLYKWNPTKIDIISLQDDDPKIIIKKLLYFFKTLGIKYWAEATIEKFVKSGYDDIFKILKGTQVVSGIGEIMFDKLKNSIKEGLKERELYEIMAASQIFGRGIAIKKFKILTDNIPDILDRSFPLPKVPGFDEKTCLQIMENLVEFKSFLSRLLEIKPDLLRNEKIKHDEKIRIVLTGFRDKHLEKEYDICDSVTKDVNFVVAKEKNSESSKIKKARDLGIPIILKEDFYLKINEKD